MKKKEEIVRFGVSMEKSLLDEFDKLITSQHYVNRSEAIRDLIRKELNQAYVQSKAEVIGILCYIYNHHIPGVTEKIIEIHHNYKGQIFSTLHFHLTHDLCLEITSVKDKAENINDFANRIKSLKGVEKITVNLFALQ